MLASAARFTRVPAQKTSQRRGPTRAAASPAASASANTRSPDMRQEETNEEIERLRKSDYVKQLLERTAAKKDERYKERLQDYNRRNFGDYFDFVAGTIDERTATDNDKEILKWVEKNK